MSRTAKANTGKNFEIAVEQFIKAIAGPTAVVTRNYIGRDKDSGEKQQMDVVVQTTIFNHLPAKILFSCKDLKRKLHAGDIRTFCRERDDAGASMGVVYSRAGFNQNALKKAAVNGISCCRLFENQPAELPESFTLLTFLCRGQLLRPFATYSPGEGIERLTWEQFLAESVTVDGEDATTLEFIDRIYRQSEKWSISQIPPGKIFPPGWQSRVPVMHKSSDHPIHLTISGSWGYYRGRHKAHLVNGSYCLTNENFQGTVSIPQFKAIGGRHPGEGWEDVSDGIDRPAGIAITIFQVGLDLKGIMLAALIGPLINTPIDSQSELSW